MLTAAELDAQAEGTGLCNRPTSMRIARELKQAREALVRESNPSVMFSRAYYAQQLAEALRRLRMHEDAGAKGVLTIPLALRVVEAARRRVAQCDSCRLSPLGDAVREYDEDRARAAEAKADGPTATREPASPDAATAPSQAADEEARDAHVRDVMNDLVQLDHPTDSTARERIARELVALTDLAAQYRRDARLRSYFQPLVDHIAKSDRVMGSIVGDELRAPKTAAGVGVPFENLTRRAQRVLQLATEFARKHDHQWVGTEHILYGLLAQGDGVAGHVLRGLGLDMETVGVNVRSTHGGLSRQMMPKLLFSKRALTVMDYAARTAGKRGDNYIGTEHLLFGIVRAGSNGNTACALLLEHGITREQVRDRTSRMLGSVGAKEND